MPARIWEEEGTPFRARARARLARTIATLAFAEPSGRWDTAGITIAAAEDGAELPAVASLAKAHCAQAYFHCAGENLQIHGGIAFTWEHDAHLYLKRAKSFDLFLGDAAYHRELWCNESGSECARNWRPHRPDAEARHESPGTSAADPESSATGSSAD